MYEYIYISILIVTGTVVWIRGMRGPHRVGGRPRMPARRGKKEFEIGLTFSAWFFASEQGVLHEASLFPRRVSILFTLCRKITNRQCTNSRNTSIVLPAQTLNSYQQVPLLAVPYSSSGGDRRQSGTLRISGGARHIHPSRGYPQQLGRAPTTASPLHPTWNPLQRPAPARFPSGFPRF